MLDLSQRELPHAQQASARRDLIAEGLANLSGRKGQLVAVVVQQVLEIDEYALRRLGPQISLQAGVGEQEPTRPPSFKALHLGEGGRAHVKRGAVPTKASP